METQKTLIKAKNPNIKSFFCNLLKVLVAILIVSGTLIIGILIVNRVYTDKSNKDLSGGFDIKTAKDYKKIWENTMSDIDGMTVWDKYTMGLAVNNGSDTDKDGLSDKSEIEIYGSDPRKLSTADDLYTDYYKIQNGMDVNQYYEYAGKKEYSYNECPEVSLEAVIPTDFNAVVINKTGENALNGDKVLAQYEVYNYAGRLSVDLSSVIADNGVSIKDIDVFVSDGKALKKYKFSRNGNVIKLKKKFNAESDYEIYVIEKSFFNRIMITFGGTSSVIAINENDVTGEGLVTCSPIISYFLGKSIDIYYQDLGNEDMTAILRDKTVNNLKYYLREKDDKYLQAESIIKAKAPEIVMRYNLLQRIVPFFDVTYKDTEELGWVNAFYLYYSYADKVAWETSSEDKKSSISTSGFDIYKDELPFKNFKSEIGTTGNCAGISHFTAYLYNTGSFIESGSYSYDNKRVTWNIGGDSDNHTLRDRGLSDYKTETFVQEHSSDGTGLSRNLSEGEKEFVKMIGANFLQGNMYVNMMYQSVYGGENANSGFEYELIDEMKSRLEAGKILDVYMRMVDGTGHAVNIYGYEAASDNPDVTWFNVYDSNFPMENVGENNLSENGFRLKVVKKLNNTGTGYRFDYYYYPLKNEKYGSTSNTSITIAPIFIVMDENWNDINPSAVYEGYANSFTFNYVSTASLLKNRNPIQLE